MSTATGYTKDSGWQLGVRRTVPVPLEQVWDYLIGQGVAEWLGDTELGRSRGDKYVTRAGERGEIRSWTDHVRIRLTWRPPNRAHDTTLQLTVQAAASGTTIGIHQERLAGPDERADMLEHWTDVVERMVRVLSPV